MREPVVGKFYTKDNLFLKFLIPTLGRSASEKIVASMENIGIACAL